MNAFLLEDGRLRVGWRFAFSVVVIAVAYIVAGIMAATLASKHSRIEDLIFSGLLFLLILGGFVGLARIFDQPEVSVAKYLGLPGAGCFRQAIAGALLGFILIFLAIVVIAIFFHYHIVKIVLTPRTLDSAGVVSISILAGAMAEELSFRGYPFHRVLEGMRKTSAVVLMSALFAVVHMGNPHVGDSRSITVFAFLNTLLIGVVLAIAYIRTRALWFSWGLHFSWNMTLGMIFGLPVSGMTDFAALVRARATGPEWLLGGAYGIEGGFLGSLVILLGLACVLGFCRPMGEISKPRIDEGRLTGIQPAGMV